MLKRNCNTCYFHLIEFEDLKDDPCETCREFSKWKLDVIEENNYEM